LPPEKISPTQNSFIKTYKAELILLMITFSWGFSFPLIKISLQFISPVLFVFLRFFFTIIIFYFVYRKEVNLKDYTQWKLGVTLGIYLFAGFCLQTLGLEYTTASKSAFITGTSLVIIPFVQFYILKIKPKVENIAGGIIVMFGLSILTEAHLTMPNIGDILTFLCAISFAIHVVLLDKYSREANFNYLAFGQFLTMVIMSILFMTVFEVYISENIFVEINTTIILSLIYCSVFATLISIVVMTKYQHRTTPVRAGIIYSMESVFAAGFAYLLLNEVLNSSQLAGVLIMIAGLLISEFYSFVKFKILK